MQVKERANNYGIAPIFGGWAASHATGSGCVSVGIHRVAYEQSAALCAADSLRNHTGGSPTYAFLVFTQAPPSLEPQRHSTPQVLTLKDKINNIRSVFGLSVTQMAEVMNVERVTVYDWLRKDSMDSVRGGSRERLNSLNDLSTTWGKYSALGGKFLYETLPNGKCVMDLLRASELDASAILQAYALLDSKQKPAQRIREHRAEQAQNTRVIGAALSSAFQQLEANSPPSEDSV